MSDHNPTPTPGALTRLYRRPWLWAVAILALTALCPCTVWYVRVRSESENVRRALETIYLAITAYANQSREEHFPPSSYFSSGYAIDPALLEPYWPEGGDKEGALKLLEKRGPGRLCYLGHAAFTWVMTVNPLAYAVSATRHALYGGRAPEALTLTASPWVDVGVVVIFALLALFAAVLVSQRKR